MIWGGSPARIVKAAEEDRVCIIISEDIVGEINRTLAYHRLKRVYENAGISRQNLVTAIFQISKLVEVKTKINVVHKDSADDKFIECAVDGKADFIVSGDDHLLKIGSYKRTRIVSVKEFLKILEK
jgi:putative PIN family toxin of toxin-antitoxin system